MFLFDPRTPSSYRYVPTTSQEESPESKTEIALPGRSTPSSEELADFEVKISGQQPDELAKAS